MNSIRACILGLGLLSMTACEPLTPTPKPDLTIRVVQGPNGKAVAIPPECPSWNTATVEPFDNQPLPQHGCANARNLASLIENPSDLILGRDLGAGRGVTAVGSVRRYDNNQPRGLLMPVAETSSVAATSAATGSSAMSGEIVTPSSGSAGASTSAP